MRSHCGVWALVALFAAPSPLLAQQDIGVDCELTEWRTLTRNPLPGDHSIVWLGTPSLECASGARVRADSAIVFSETGLSQLRGNVVFVDGPRELRAAEADHYTVQGQLFARGAVVFRDRDAGSDIRGDSLTLLEVTDSRPTEQLTVRGRPATALLPREDSTGAVIPGGAYALHGSVLRFEGDRFVWADGDAEVERDSLRITSDSLAFDREGGTLLFTGGARMAQEDGVFEGDRMTVRLRDDAVESVYIQGNGRLVSEDLDLVAPEITVTVSRELIQRVLALGDQNPATDGVQIPYLVAEEFFIAGDTLDILSPDEVLERVHATGGAWGQTYTRGDPPPPLDVPPSERLARGPLSSRDLEHDWIEATQIEVLFARSGDVAAPISGADEGAEFYVSQLTGDGSARTLYRAPPEDEGTGAEEPERERWPISYLLAEWIRLDMLEDGSVQTIEAVGGVTGVQLDPVTSEAEPASVEPPPGAAP